jgi:hypothetical protein
MMLHKTLGLVQDEVICVECQKWIDLGDFENHLVNVEGYNEYGAKATYNSEVLDLMVIEQPERLNPNDYFKKGE